MDQYAEALALLGPAQRALTENVLASPGTDLDYAAAHIAYASNLNDYQALAVLSVREGVNSSLRDPDGFIEMRNLSQHYGIPIVNYGQAPLANPLTEKQVQNLIGASQTPATAVAINPMSPAIVVDTPAAQPTVVVQSPVTAAVSVRLPIIPPEIATWTLDQKVSFYRQLIAQGWTDAQIRAGVTDTLGVQPDDAWQMLVRLATTIRKPAAVNPQGGGAGALIAAAAVAYFLLG